ncbi:MAG TPA: hypothetical protein VI565_06175, partial [Burkholderiales bacterium]|nr:hypothetical protein [Burkholderiales bacterium]
MQIAYSRLRRILWPVLAWLVITPGSGVRAQDAIESAVVRFQNREIATLRATLGPLSPEARADAAMQRLSRLTPRDLLAPVVVVNYGDARAVVIGDRMLFGIAPDDVDASAGENVDTVAAAAADNLRAAIAAWTKQRRPEVIVGGTIHVLIACVVAFLFLLALRWLRRIALHRLSARAEQKLEKRQIRLFGQDINRAAIKVLRIAINAFVGVSLLTLAYVWVTYSLRQFPVTEPWGDGLAGFLLGTLQMIASGILHGIPDMTVVILVLV